MKGKRGRKKKGKEEDDAKEKEKVEEDQEEKEEDMDRCEYGYFLSVSRCARLRQYYKGPSE